MPNYMVPASGADLSAGLQPVALCFHPGDASATAQPVAICFHPGDETTTVDGHRPVSPCHHPDDDLADGLHLALTGLDERHLAAVAARQP
jgi:hypothetical protein